MPRTVGRRQTGSPPWAKFEEGERCVGGEEMSRAVRRQWVATGERVRAMGKTKMEGESHPGWWGRGRERLWTMRGNVPLRVRAMAGGGG